jgi:transposase-like protein
MEIAEEVKVTKLKRKHHSRKEKNRYYKAWKKSGLSQSKFCEANTIAIQTFSKWVKRIEKKSASRLSFIPLERIVGNPECKQSRQNTQNKQSLEIQLSNGIVCRFSELNDVLQISQLIQGLHHVFIAHSK